MKSRITSLLRIRANFFWLIFLLIVGIPLSVLAQRGMLFQGSVESARYLLSALMQTQAAIIAIVITLTVVAIQLMSQAYSVRVVDLFLKSKSFWLLLLLYVVSISYDAVLLSMLTNSNVVDFMGYINVSIFGLVVTLAALFPYTKDTIQKLQPKAILDDLGNQVLKTKQDLVVSKQSDALLSLIDSIKRAIRRDDTATARAGIEKINEIFLEVLNADFDEREKNAAMELLRALCHRTSDIAFAQDDSQTVARIAECMRSLGNTIVEKLEINGDWDWVTRDLGLGQLSFGLQEIGVKIAQKNWLDVPYTPAEILTNWCGDCLKRFQQVPISLSVSLPILLIETMEKNMDYAICDILQWVSDLLLSLIPKKLPKDSYDQLHEVMLPAIIRGTEKLGKFKPEWMSHLVYSLTQIGVESVEAGIEGGAIRDCLVRLVGGAIILELDPSEVTAAAITELRDRASKISYQKTDVGAMWVTQCLEKIGVRLAIDSRPKSAGEVTKVLGAICQRSALETTEQSDVPLKSLKSIFSVVVETDDEALKKETQGLLLGVRRELGASKFRKILNASCHQFRLEKSEIKTQSLEAFLHSCKEKQQG